MILTYKKFFKEKIGFPKFKSKKTNRFSYKTNFTNGNIELCHDYSPEVLLFSAKNGIVHEENVLHLFKEEYLSSLFSDYFRYHVEKQNSLEYQFDDDLKGKNLNCEFLDGTVSKGKILIHKKNKR